MVREARILVELSHDNVVKLEGFVEDIAENRVWLIYLWEEYGDLKNFVASQDWEVPERISLVRWHRSPSERPLGMSPLDARRDARSRISPFTRSTDRSLRSQGGGFRCCSLNTHDTLNPNHIEKRIHNLEMPCSDYGFLFCSTIDQRRFGPGNRGRGLVPDSLTVLVPVLIP